MINHKSNILVSICCVTYNHASFIRKALDGFLMQESPSCMPKDAKLSDWCEILIHDDCSTDGTTEIVREYAARYPDVIFPLYEEVNQFSRGGAGKMDLYNYDRAKGKYIAYCEGDDYWTDAHKLQKQVDFMESHPDYSVCWHRCKQLIVQTNQLYEDECEIVLPKEVEGMDIDLDTYFARWYTQPLTMVFRVSMFDFTWRDRYKYYRDMHEMYHLLKAGKGYLFAFDGGVYVKHSGGIASEISREAYCKISLPMDREFYWKTHAKGAKKTYIETLDACVRTYSKSNKLKAFRCAIVRLLLLGHPHGFVRQMKSIFSKEMG